MDPFTDIFAFISNNDTNDINFFKDGIMESKKQSLPKNNKSCFFCEVGEVHNECTHVKKGKKKVKDTDGEYACDKCDYTCDTKQLLRNHIEAVHLKVKNYKCSSCSWVCSYNKQTLKNHIKRRHKEDSSRMITIGCSLCENNQSHKFCGIHGRKPKKTERNYSCQKCEYTSEKNEHMKMHIEAVHLKIKRYRCSVCDFAAYRRQEIELHMKPKHKHQICRVFIIGCPLCERKEKHEICVKQPKTQKADSKTHVDIKRRWRGILRSEGINKCTEKNCDFASDNKESLRGHVESIHNGILKYKCNICDYKSYHKFSIANHQKISSHSDKKNKVLRIGCTLCEEDIFHTQHSISVGKERKESRGVKETLICLEPACIYVTDLKNSITSHYRKKHIHNSSYTCNLCSYRSSGGGNIEKHQKANHRRVGQAKVIAIGCKACEENIEHRNHTFPARTFDYGHCLLCKCGVEHSEHKFTTVQGWMGTGECNNRNQQYTKLKECSICGIKLIDRKSHVQHYQKEHPNDKIFKCKDCKYATNYLPNLNTHASSKHEKKVRQCSLCSYNTTWNTSFLEHMRNAHGLFQKKSKYFVESETHPILCDDCGFSSYSQKQFNAHKLANCQSKPSL